MNAVDKVWVRFGRHKHRHEYIGSGGHCQELKRVRKCFPEMRVGLMCSIV